MKIGLLTFHREINAGANLQAYALNSFLISRGFDVEIIDYIPNSGIDKRSWKRKALHLAKVFLLTSAKKEAIKKHKYFKFQNNYYHLSNRTYFGDLDIKRNLNGYDTIISGSDQIFNLLLSNYSFSYYLPFNSIRKISYASSFGRSSISDIEKWAILRYLPEFDNLSFREESGCEIVSQLIDTKEKNVVVDPVFLLNQEEWIKLTAKKSKTKTRYILIYAMEYSEWMERTINDVALNNKNHDVVIIYGTNCFFDIKTKHKCISIFDPIDFVTLFLNSDIIVTNSFHGLAFSFIFQKKVYCCAHSSRNARLENLLTLAGENNKMINKHTKQIELIDGETAYNKMKGIIDNSKRYLISALEDKND